VCAAARVTTNRDVVAVTSLYDELFVWLDREMNQIAVYSINDYQLLRHLHVPWLKPRYKNDITTCVNCLYMSDFDNRCIRRSDLVGCAITWWPLPFCPIGLSVTPNDNLLVIRHKGRELMELCAYSGQCVRQIALQPDIEWPWYGVQLTTGQYVVCHGQWDDDSLQRVCLVGDDGKVTRSYGGQRGSNVGQLDYPCHLAVDEDSQSIFVADFHNNRVVLLSETLEFVRYVHVSEELSKPHQLYLHQATRRLFVGQQGEHDVTVIQL